MGDVVRLLDLDDARVRDYRGLTDVELRRRVEPEHGMFLAEGEKVIRRAVAAGYRVRSMLLTEKWLPPLADVVAATDAPALLADEELVERITGYHVHRGALAAMERKPLPAAADLLATTRRVVVLEDVNDPENVGAVFRNAAALGMDAVVLRCGDPLYRRSVKVSMGAVFTLPYARLDEWHGGPELLRAHGFSLLALTPAADALPIAEATRERRERVALLLGAEGPGLSRRWLAEADLLVRIPMARDVDSLNVAAATAVACWVVQQGDGRTGPV